MRSEALGLRPEFDHVRTVQRDAYRSSEESRSPRQSAVNERGIRKATLTWRSASDGVRYVIGQLFADAAGCAMTFMYTPVLKTDADAFEARFVPGSLKMRRVSGRNAPGKHEITIEIEEAL